MKLSFYPTVNNFPIDGEKLFMQFLLAAFALFFIYIVSRSMRIVEENHKRTNKKITQLKTRLNIVLAHNAPVCESVLYHHIVRCRRSLLAGYLKDLMNEKEYVTKIYSQFYQDLPQSSTNKPNFSCTTVQSERVDAISNLNTKQFSEKENSSGKTVPNEKNMPDEKVITEENLCRQENNVEDSGINEITVNRPLESMIFKTLEGQTQRSTIRSNIYEKKKTKVPKWNMAQGLRNVHEACHENLKVCSALNDTKSLFKVSSTKKPLLLKSQHDFCHDNFKVYTALTNSRSPFKVSSFKKPPPQKINLSSYWHINTSNAQLCSKRSNSKTRSTIGRDVQNMQRNEKLVNETHESSFENENDAQAMVTNNAEECSVCSSGFESDLESEAYTEHCPPVTNNNTNNLQKSILTTINEESAEETNSID